MGSGATNPVTAIARAAASTVSGLRAATVILCDTSGSMGELLPDGAAKIDRLREALRAVWAQVPGCCLIAFDSAVRHVPDPDRLPRPNGGTALHAALAEAVALAAGQTIVISDGQPDDKQRALAEAHALRGTIDTIYIGPEHDREAIRFLDELAAAGGGQAVVQSVDQADRLVAPLRAVLGLPAPRPSS